MWCLNTVDGWVKNQHSEMQQQTLNFIDYWDRKHNLYFGRKKKKKYILSASFSVKIKKVTNN